MFIGDSVTAGIQVNDNETFSYLVQNYNNKFATYNYGVNGFASDQSLLTLKLYATHIMPQYVFYTFVINDPEFNLKKELTHNGMSWGKPFFDKDLVLNEKEFSTKNNNSLFINIRIILSRNSKLYNLTKEILNSYIRKNKTNPFCKTIEIDRYSEFNSYEWNERWLMTKKLINQMNIEADKINSKLVIIDNIDPFYNEKLKRKLSQCDTNGNKIDIDFPRNRIKKIANELHIDIIQTSINENRKYSIVNNCELNFIKNSKILDGHLSKCGHMFLSKKIIEYIQNNIKDNN